MGIECCSNRLALLHKISGRRKQRLHQRGAIRLGPVGVVLRDVTPNTARRRRPLEAVDVDFGSWPIRVRLLGLIEGVKEAHASRPAADQRHINRTRTAGWFLFTGQPEHHFELVERRGSFK